MEISRAHMVLSWSKKYVLKASVFSVDCTSKVLKIGNKLLNRDGLLTALTKYIAIVSSREINAS